MVRGSDKREGYWWGHDERASLQVILKSEADIVKERPETRKKKNP